MQQKNPLPNEEGFYLIKLQKLKPDRQDQNSKVPEVALYP